MGLGWGGSCVRGGLSFQRLPVGFLKNNFVVNADGVGWGWDGVGRV